MRVQVSLKLPSAASGELLSVDDDLANFYEYLARTVVQESALSISERIDRLSRAERHLKVILKNLQRVDPIVFGYDEYQAAVYWLSLLSSSGLKKRLTSKGQPKLFSRLSAERSFLVNGSKIRSLRQTERLGIMALLAHFDCASGPVRLIQSELAKWGCRWTFHRINARVNNFLLQRTSQKRAALLFHFERFKVVEHLWDHPDGVVAYRERNHRLTILGDDEERMLEELLQRGGSYRKVCNAGASDRTTRPRARRQPRPR